MPECIRFASVVDSLAFVPLISAEIEYSDCLAQTILRGPRIGTDHWHATYEIHICGDRQPDLPEWRSGVHTHGEDIIHIHPFELSEEGPGAALRKFFEYGGGILTADSIRIPGSDITYRTSDTCRDGQEAGIDVWVNGEPAEGYPRYIPQDGDLIVISFGPEGSVIIETPSPVCAPPDCSPTPATRY